MRTLPSLVLFPLYTFKAICSNSKIIYRWFRKTSNKDLSKATCVCTFRFQYKICFFPEMLFDFFSPRGISSKLDKQRNLISSRNNRLGKKPLVLTFTALCFPDLKNKFSVLGRWKHFSEIKDGTSESLIIILVNSKIFIFKTWLVRLFESMKKLINNHFNI